jgi:hypothetical protein
MSSSIVYLNDLHGKLNNITGDIDDSKQDIHDIYNTIYDNDKLIGDILRLFGNFIDYLKMASLAFYGAILGISAFALIGVVMLSCFDKVGCRHLMYISCVVLLIICILGFLICTVLSLLIPILYFGC